MIVKSLTKTFFALFTLISFTGFSTADSTLLLSLNDADSLFLKNNLSLISANYNISAAKALKIQAKLYPNPNLYIEQSLVNKYTRNGYDSTLKASNSLGTTENIVNFQQLILLAGKRNKQIKIADINIELAETDFEILLRTLRYTLHNDLCQLYFNQQSLKLLEEEQASISIISKGLNEQVSKGFISLNEATRIKTLLYELDKQITDYNNINFNILSEINILLGVAPNTVVKPVIKNRLQSDVLPVSIYLDSALIYNPDVKNTNYKIELAKAQYNYNRALAIPDAMLQGSYDKAGNYLPHYFGIGIGINLPTFNRNQGNIKASQFLISQTETDLRLQQNTVLTHLVSNYNTFDSYRKLLTTYDNGFEDQILQLMDKLMDSYKNRVLSLNEFTNYYESYKQNYLGLLQTKANYLQNIEQLNFLIGKPLIKYE